MHEHESPPSPHVLIVANSETTLTSLAEHLTTLGQIVAVAQHTREVLAHSAERQWDAVVIDLTPTEHALDLVRQLHQQQPDLAAIILSSDDHPSAVRAGFQAGAYLWLPAPCPLEVVATAVLRAHERRLLQQTHGRSRDDEAPSRLAHTVNNQLAGIMGLAQLHMADETLPSDLRSDFEVILQSARAIGDLLKSLRTD